MISEMIDREISIKILTANSAANFFSETEFRKIFAEALSALDEKSIAIMIIAKICRHNNDTEFISVPCRSFVRAKKEIRNSSNASETAICTGPSCENAERTISAKAAAKEMKKLLSEKASISDL